MTDDIYHSDFQLGPDLAGKRIVVAMSGGVDSSVVAALAARSGAETIGVTLQLYDHGSAVKRAGACCAGQDIRDARAVADKLGIAHYVFDHESQFRESVIDHFADEYMAGRTPIPCVRCNMGVKFTDLFRLAKELGADCLATGHYVRRVMGDGGAELHRGIDPGKDQSYFLHRLSQAQLSRVMFPLSQIPKAEVRRLAQEAESRNLLLASANALSADQAASATSPATACKCPAPSCSATPPSSPANRPAPPPTCRTSPACSKDCQLEYICRPLLLHPKECNESWLWLIL